MDVMKDRHVDLSQAKIQNAELALWAYAIPSTIIGVLLTCQSVSNMLEKHIR